MYNIIRTIFWREEKKLGFFRKLSNILTGNLENDADPLKQVVKQHDIVPIKNIQSNDHFLKVHPDILELLWIGDGPKKNYIESKGDFYSNEYIKINISTSWDSEPSLIYTNLPIKEPANFNSIERPPYYPSYSSLTPQQRWVYFKLLNDPYSKNNDIGYVFILYYGLERQLFEGDFEKAFNVILKLRDIYDNQSFQFYSAKALILSCLYHQSADFLSGFLFSIDKDYEANIPSNLLILCLFSLGIMLTASDLMRSAKDFEFENQRYIKSSPELFLEILQKNIKSKYSTDGITLSNFFTKNQLTKVTSKESVIYANTSLSNVTVSVPELINNFKFKKEMFELLEGAHQQTKETLAQMRKNGDAIPVNENKITKPKKELVFSKKEERNLLMSADHENNDPIALHFVYMQLQDFYYKYRSLEQRYLNQCINFCLKDIDSFDSLNKAWIQREKKELKRMISSSLSNPEDIRRQEFEIEKGFHYRIPAFKRLAIIYEQKKQYDDAIKICERSIELGFIDDGTDGGFNGRKQKLESKLKSAL